MPGYFELKVIDVFSSAHSLREYEGNCERIHGHNWKVEAVISCDALDNRGIGIDFKDMKGALKAVLGDLDHKNLNEIAPFDRINPSSENLASYIFSRLESTVPPDVRVQSVTVWESDSASASYVRK